LRRALAGHGISSTPSTTHILPVVIGDNRGTMEICEQLLKRGYFAQGIRFPSVPAGSERLRITLMATHTEEDIDGLATALAELIPPNQDRTGSA